MTEKPIKEDIGREKRIGPELVNPFRQCLRLDIISFDNPYNTISDTPPPGIRYGEFYGYMLSAVLFVRGKIVYKIEFAKQNIDGVKPLRFSISSEGSEYLSGVLKIEDILFANFKANSKAYEIAEKHEKDFKKFLKC